MFVHWTWNTDGWLQNMNYIDFAGSGVIHSVGGVAGLISTIMLGARKGRFDPNTDENEFKPNDILSSTLSVFLLWFCWYGFNCGSTGFVVGENITLLVGKVGINTSIAASSGGITVFLIHYFINRKNNTAYSIGALFNGILAGLVGITAPCGGVEPFCAFFIGVIAGFIYFTYNKALARLKIDDPIDAIAVHMGCGLWGCIAVGIFDQSNGFLYGKGGYQLGVQVLAAVVAIGWTAANTFIVCLLLKLAGIFRIDDDAEAQGMDVAKCGGYVNNYDAVAKKHYAEIFCLLGGKTIETPKENVIKIELSDKVIIKGDEINRKPIDSEGNHLEVVDK
jgi:Amt family ammonium transporter